MWLVHVKRRVRLYLLQKHFIGCVYVTHHNHISNKLELHHAAQPAIDIDLHFRFKTLSLHLESELCDNASETREGVGDGDVFRRDKSISNIQ